MPDGAQSYGSNLAATALPDGTTLQAFAGTLGTWVHAGLSPATPNHDYQAQIGPYGYYPNLATDAGGRTVMAWYSNASGHLGVLVEDVGADGSPSGGFVTMPNTSNGVVTRFHGAALAEDGAQAAISTAIARARALIAL